MEHDTKRLERLALAFKNDCYTILLKVVCSLDNILKYQKVPKNLIDSVKIDIDHKSSTFTREVNDGIQTLRACEMIVEYTIKDLPTVAIKMLIAPKGDDSTALILIDGNSYDRYDAQIQIANTIKNHLIQLTSNKEEEYQLNKRTKEMLLTLDKFYCLSTISLGGKQKLLDSYMEQEASRLKTICQHKWRYIVETTDIEKPLK
jgi:hypothetical protein